MHDIPENFWIDTFVLVPDDVANCFDIGPGDLSVPPFQLIGYVPRGFRNNFDGPFNTKTKEAVAFQALEVVWLDRTLYGSDTGENIFKPREDRSPGH